MADPLTIDSSYVSPGDVVRFVPRDRKRRVMFLVALVEWHDSGYAMLTGCRCRWDGNELDGYTATPIGNVITYLAPAIIERAVPGEDR